MSTRRLRVARGFVLAVVLCAMALVVSSCASDFDPISKLKSVRMLATRIDKPYAKPGETVTFETLAFDARVDKSRPMKLSWIPLPCINPTNDLYYLCFQQLAAANGDGGTPAPGSPGALLRPGVDLTPFLPGGPTYSFTIPTNIVDTHPPVPGASDLYGLAIVFNIACAGHVEITLPGAGDIRKQQVPIGCFDENHTRLGADDFVIGIQRVYAYNDRTNANPVIDHVVFEGQPVDLSQGIAIDHCTAARSRDCAQLKMDVVVPDTSWETNPGDTDVGGKVRNEQIWVDYYSTIGDFSGDARLLYDPAQGHVSDSETKYQSPFDPGDGVVFVVVHDNRGGAAWAQFPVHVR